MWRQKGAAGKKQRPAVWVTAGVYAQQVKPEKLGLQPRPQVRPAIDRNKNRSSDWDCPRFLFIESSAASQGMLGALLRRPKPPTIAVLPFVGNIFRGAGTRQVWIRVRVEIMGSQNCRIVGKSQPVLFMINPIIFTRTRIILRPRRARLTRPTPRMHGMGLSLGAVCLRLAWLAGWLACAAAACAMATTNQQNTIYHEPAVEALRRVAERDDVAAVVLRVDSGGGDALASCAALIDSQCRPER
jgi:hypothetical protein